MSFSEPLKQDPGCPVHKCCMNCKRQGKYVPYHKNCGDYLCQTCCGNGCGMIPSTRSEEDHMNKNLNSTLDHPPPIITVPTFHWITVNHHNARSICSLCSMYSAQSLCASIGHSAALCRYWHGGRSGLSIWAYHGKSTVLDQTTKGTGRHRLPVSLYWFI